MTISGIGELKETEILAYAGIKALFDAALDDGESTPYAPLTLAPEIAAPTLLIAGELDRLAPPADLEALAAAFPTRARTRVVAGVGHTVPIEAAEPWRAAVLDFLDGAGAAGDGTDGGGTAA